MKIKLLKDIYEGVAHNALGQLIDPGKIKTVVRKNRPKVEFKEGNVIEMSDASGQKYIDAKAAEAYVEPTA